MKSFSPWWSLVLLIGLNFFLAQVTCANSILTIGALLLLMTVFFLESRRLPVPVRQGPEEGTLGPFSRVLWLLLLGLVLFLRLYHLGEPWPWPNRDEGLHGMFGLALGEHWSWKFFYTFGQHPPLLIWGLRFFLRWCSSPFWGLWLFPTLAGIAAWGFGTLALRVFFPRSFALIGSVLLGLGLWPFYAGRWCQQGSLIPAWEMFCFWMIAVILKEGDPARRKKGALALGLAAGAGSFIFTVWPVGVVMVGLGLFFGTPEAKARRGELLPFFIPTFLLALTPFLWAAHAEGFGGHMGAMSAVSGWFSASHQALTVLSYIAALFWGKWEDDSLYLADSGGFLDPLWGAVFFIGLARVWGRRKEPLYQWVLVSFLLGLIPGLLTMNVEMFRAIGSLPFLYLVTAWGAEDLLARVRGQGLRWVLFFGALVLGLAWNGHRFLQYRADPELNRDHWEERAISLEYRRAWEVLGELSRRNGPGWIFTELLETPYDQTPWVTTYGMNAAGDPALGSRNVAWAAVLTLRDEETYLTSRFPQGRMVALRPALPLGQDRCLFLMPVNEATRPTLENWKKAHAYFQELSFAINSISEARTYQEAVKVFERAPAEVFQDPFLASCYWEKKSQFFYNYGFQEHYEDQCDALRRAIQAHPAAHLRYDLGCLLMRRRHFGEARKELEAALRQKPGDADIQDALRFLRNQEPPAKGTR